ncbi:MAG TPA: flavodoxin family protein [Desulfobacteraceae bacterium]|nr:flavodoxin family protein [Deltaproteobacteria bacterium]MBW2357070.1 flavodoxin family protein [Deltaproteobacteria bacterium]RLB99084.1 MAG: flavodoxin family protein [Deltaproteobacteria bacterium]HDI61125.1 flavodoxin family protein [Desulfobacteraceae bacterium]
MFSEPQRLLAIGASPRPGGNTDAMLKWIVEGAASVGQAMAVVQLRDVLVLPCIGCERCRRDKRCTGRTDAMQLLYPLIEAAEGLVLASPTHHYNVTAWMKAFIDRLYCYYDFSDHRPRRWSSRLAGRGRRALVCTVAEQPATEDLGFTLEAMARPLTALGYRVIDQLAAQPFFDRGSVRRDPLLAERMRTAGARLARAGAGDAHDA